MGNRRRISRKQLHIRRDVRVDHVKILKEVSSLSNINVIIKDSEFFKSNKTFSKS